MTPLSWRTPLVAALILAAMSLPLAVLAEEGNEAGLVIQFGDGRVETRCIAFEEEVVSGAELLARSGLEVLLDPASSMGVTVCQIEGEGCEAPAEACFCQCMGGGECAYWNYFYRDDGEGEWAYSALGAAMRKVSDGSVEAWVWGGGGVPPTNDLRFETICAAAVASATSTPEPSTPVPATAETELATRPSDLAANSAGEDATLPTPHAALATSDPAEGEGSPTRPASLPPAPGSTPSSSSEGVSTLEAGASGGGPEEGGTSQEQPTDSPGRDSGSGVADYWPFGLMVVGLAIVGLVIWRRQS